MGTNSKIILVVLFLLGIFLVGYSIFGGTSKNTATNMVAYPRAPSQFGVGHPTGMAGN